MDGIAVSYAGTQRHRDFQIQTVQHAGDPPCTLASEHHCIEIMTGAQLPHGCDCVIPIEVYEKNGTQITLQHDYTPAPKKNIHTQGSDRKQGQTLLNPGIQIMAPEMAILASAGKAKVKVSRPIKTAILSTGSELVDVDAPIQQFQIRRSNDRALAVALIQAGFDQVSRHHLVDDPEALEQKIRDLLTHHDFLVVSGGVSKGVKDFIPGILENLGVQKHFHRIAQRPGKPMWFGTTPNNKTVFGLPGNPVSSLVCLRRYVIPACRQSLGLASAPETWVKLDEPVFFEPELTWFLPVTLHGDQQGLHAKPAPTNTSGDFVSLGGTQGFVELDSKTTEFPKGYKARFFSW